METLINASLSKNILLDWSINHQGVEGELIVGVSGFPFGRRNNLSYK